MFCSQCGKKVLDTMLFCPFCGSEIVVPEQEEDLSQQPQPEPVEQKPVVQPEKLEKEDFVPLNLDIDWSAEDVETDEADGEEDAAPVEPAEEDARPETRNVSDEISELLSSQLEDKPSQKPERAPSQKKPDPKKKAKETVKRTVNAQRPAREFNPDDIFLDGGDVPAYDDYDDDDYDYEEPEEGGFWIRHVRGIVAFSLMIILAAIMAGWAFSGAGQLALAQANLAWKPEVYADLGYQAYEAGDYLLSGSYFERALSRDPDNYNYANSSGVAYYWAKDAANAEKMGKRAVEIDPSRVDAYQLLLYLYPNVSTRPWEIQSLIQQGYQYTGDEALKPQ